MKNGLTIDAGPRHQTEDSQGAVIGIKFDVDPQAGAFATRNVSCWTTGWTGH
jgi:hypothetical protein